MRTRMQRRPSNKSMVKRGRSFSGYRNWLDKVFTPVRAGSLTIVREWQRAVFVVLPQGQDKGLLSSHGPLWIIKLKANLLYALFATFLSYSFTQFLVGRTNKWLKRVLFPIQGSTNKSNKFLHPSYSYSIYFLITDNAINSILVRIAVEMELEKQYSIRVSGLENYVSFLSDTSMNMYPCYGLNCNGEPFEIYGPSKLHICFLNALWLPHDFFFF